MMTHLAVILAVLTSCASAALAKDVVVFAAASTKTALDRIAADFQAATGHNVAISYASSSALAKQIIAGAPADLFISAAPIWMDEVEKAGLLATASRRNILGNRLVLVGRPDAAEVTISAKLDLAGLIGEGKLAMALVDSAPAGQYGKAALSALGLWGGVAANIAQADNVRAALAYVAQGEAPLGIVYATDAAAEPKVKILGTFPASSYPSIVYPAALTATAADAADRAFFDMLISDQGLAAFEAQGFVVLKQGN